MLTALDVPHILFREDGSVACYSLILPDKSIEQIISSSMTYAELLQLQNHFPFVALGQIMAPHYYGVNIELPPAGWFARSVAQLGKELEMSWDSIVLKQDVSIVDLAVEQSNYRSSKANDSTDQDPINKRNIVSNIEVKNSALRNQVNATKAKSADCNLGVESSDSEQEKNEIQENGAFEKLSSTMDLVQRRNVGGRERMFYVAPRSDSKHPKVFTFRCKDIDDTSDVVRIILLT